MKKLNEFTVLYSHNGDTDFIGSNATLGKVKQIIAKHLKQNYKQGDKYVIMYPGKPTTNIDVVETMFKYVCYLEGYKNSQIRITKINVEKYQTRTAEIY